MDRYSWYVFVAFSGVIQQNKKSIYIKENNTGQAFTMEIMQQLFLWM